MNPRKTEQGSIAIMAAFSLMVVILTTGFVYEFGMVLATKGELQHVADSAAMVGARALGVIYAGGEIQTGSDPLSRKTFASQKIYELQDSDSNLIQNVVIHSGNHNTANGLTIDIETADITIGTWNNTTISASPPILRPNAVQVIVRRNHITSNPFGALIGHLANWTGYDLSATATAALTPLQYIPPAPINIPPTLPPGPLSPGPLILPLGIDQEHFVIRDPNFCTASFDLPSDAFDQPCHAWTTFENEATEQNFQNIVNQTQSSPGTTAGSINIDGTKYYFGGFGAERAADLTAIYFANRPAGSTSWETLLPVYANSGCVAPTNQQISIVGFISVSITQSPDFPFPLQIAFQCNVVGTGRSGDLNDPNLFDFGTRGSVPVLVE